MPKKEENFSSLALCQKESRFQPLGTSRKSFLRAKYKKKKLFWRSNQKTKVTQTKKSNFADRNGQVKKTNFELELIKTSEFFLVDKSIYTSNLVNQMLSKKAPQTLTFFIAKILVKINWQIQQKNHHSQQYRNNEGTIKQTHSTD